jgi:hypothetical protein
MKKALFLFLSITFLLCSCQPESNHTRTKIIKKEVKKPIHLTPEELIYDHGGKYIERYTNGQTKMEGQKNEDGTREGYWVSFGEKGNKQSECSYSKGKKHGISIVYHPNGQPSYQGEYNMDKRTGTWKFFNSAGTVVKTEVVDK